MNPALALKNALKTLRVLKILTHNSWTVTSNNKRHLPSSLPVYVVFFIRVTVNVNHKRSASVKIGQNAGIKLIIFQTSLLQTQSSTPNTIFKKFYAKNLKETFAKVNVLQKNLVLCDSDKCQLTLLTENNELEETWKRHATLSNRSQKNRWV